MAVIYPIFYTEEAHAMPRLQAKMAITIFIITGTPLCVLCNVLMCITPN